MEQLISPRRNPLGVPISQVGRVRLRKVPNLPRITQLGRDLYPVYLLTSPEPGGFQKQLYATREGLQHFAGELQNAHQCVLFCFVWLKPISQKYSEFQKCLPGRMNGEPKLHVRGGLLPASSNRGEENSGIKECAASGI